MRKVVSMSVVRFSVMSLSRSATMIVPMDRFLDV